MARSLGVGEYAEPDDSMMDPVNSKPAFRGLKRFVNELDSNTLPPFLARVCALDKPSKYSEEEILCIFETAAEVHGRNIAPHIGQIVSTVVRIMSSDSKSLHSSGCSKVICTLSRYGIDPMGREEEKSGFISSLCRPLSDCLMNPNKNISSGSALCTTALVQSNNWQFASNDLVNDVCLKVSGALEEAHCQTIVHLSLVVALSKHNPLTLEPYGRSLIRSGLQILDGSTQASNSQMIMSSIQVIHSIMKSLDVRIISSEIDSIIHALEQCQHGFVPDICTTAVQAAETAKVLGKHEECGDHKKVSPLANYSGRHSRNGSNSPIDDIDIRGSASSGSPCEMQSVRSFAGFGSHPSVIKCPDVLESARARRRLWSDGSHSSHGMPNNEVFHTTTPGSHDDLGVRRQSTSASLVKSSRRYSGVFTRIGDPCPTCLRPRTTNQSSQVSRRQALSGDIMAQSTPRKQSHSSFGDSERDGHHLPENPAFRQIQCSENSADYLVSQKNGGFEERKGYCYSIEQGNQRHEQNTDLFTEELKFPTNSGCSDSARTPCEIHQAGHEKMTGRKKREANRSSSPTFPFVCVVVIVIALLLAWWKPNPSEPYFVPT